MSILDTILETIFPQKCSCCGLSGKNLCSRCLSTCPQAERETPPWVYPLFDYRHPPIKKIIWLIKYSGKKRILKDLAEILYERIIEEYSELKIMENFKNPILIPVPLSKKRYKERGYNQAEFLCREIIKIDANKYLTLDTNILFKNKETEHQAKIKDKSHRLRNLSGTFEIKTGINLKNKNIILIDDVTTTGATLTEAKKVLKNAGARKIIAFTIAH